jgi:hypothetical protein
MQTSISEPSFTRKWARKLHKKSAYSNYRRPSHCSEQSVCSNTSTSTLDKLLQAIPGLFKRRSSNASAQSYDTYDEERQRLDELYLSALDELSYAQDSQGSRYYSGDLDCAREAIDRCSQACVQLLNQAPDQQCYNHLQNMINKKLLPLQLRLDALPSISSGGSP